jgi:hypothetical protein
MPPSPRSTSAGRGTSSSPPTPSTASAQNTINPVTLEFNQATAAATWTCDVSAYLPFGGWSREVTAVVTENPVTNAGERAPLRLSLRHHARRPGEQPRPPHLARTGEGSRPCDGAGRPPDLDRPGFIWSKYSRGSARGAGPLAWPEKGGADSPLALQPQIPRRSTKARPNPPFRCAASTSSTAKEKSAKST